MATSFERIYDKFLNKIDDARLVNRDDKELEDTLYLYLESAIVDFKKCKKQLEKNINKEKQQFEVDLNLEEIEILSLAMVIHWLEPNIRTKQLLRQSIGDRDFKLSSNWETLRHLQALEETTKRELKNKIVSYSYNDLANL